MLTRQQRQAFAVQGFVPIPGAFSRIEAQAMEDQIWTALKQKYGAIRTDPATWTAEFVSGLQPLKQLPVFAPIGSKTTLDAITDLLGEGRWKYPKDWGQFLVTFPTQGPWTVPYGWHIDFDFQMPPDGLSGLLMFSFLADVAPQGGGTAVLNGSHHLMRRFVETQPSETFATAKRGRKAFLSSDPWLQDLSSDKKVPGRVERFMASEHMVDGVSLKVSELSGKAGDIVIAHPWLLHCTAPNCGHWPRFMRVQRIRLADNSGFSETAPSAR